MGFRHTRYVELLALQNVPAFDEPIGPGYLVAFDETVPTKGFSEIRLWVHIFAINYETTPITPATELLVRFFHQFAGGSFEYQDDTLTSNVTSYINGYVAAPIIGDQTRLHCHPTNIPAGPYKLHVTYYLVR